MSTTHTSMYPAQLIFWEIIETSEENRALLSRIALTLSNDGEEYDFPMSQMIACLRWTEYHAVVAMLMLKANANVRWSDRNTEQLKNWARTTN